jgi:hypothetical protein
MAASGKRIPMFKARLYDMEQVSKGRYATTEALDIIVYIPEGVLPAKPYRRVVSDEKNRIAFSFTGAAIAPSEKELRRLCMRLTFVRDGLVELIRQLAAKAARGAAWKR